MKALRGSARLAPLAALVAMLVLGSVPLTAAGSHGLTFNNSGGDDVVNVIHHMNDSTFVLNDTSPGRHTLWNVMADGGHDNFTLYNQYNASDTWMVMGGGNDIFNVYGAGRGNCTYQLMTGSNSSFNVVLGGNNTLKFAFTGFYGMHLNATETGDGGNGTETWSINFGSNSTVLLPKLSGNDTINVVF